MEQKKSKMTSKNNRSATTNISPSRETEQHRQEYIQKLIEVKDELLNSELMRSYADLHISGDDLAESGDLAAHIVDQNITMNVRQKQLDKLKDIEMALLRAQGGQFTYCQECDDVIPYQRLLKSPWATLCVHCKSEREKQENMSAAGI